MNKNHQDKSSLEEALRTYGVNALGIDVVTDAISRIEDLHGYVQKLDDSQLEGTKGLIRCLQPSSITPPVLFVVYWNPKGKYLVLDWQETEFC